MFVAFTVRRIDKREPVGHPGEREREVMLSWQNDRKDSIHRKHVGSGPKNIFLHRLLLFSLFFFRRIVHKKKGEGSYNPSSL